MMGYGMKILGAEFKEDQSMKKSEKCLIYWPDIRSKSSETKIFVIDGKIKSNLFFLLGFILMLKRGFRICHGQPFTTLMYPKALFKANMTISKTNKTYIVQQKQYGNLSELRVKE